MTRHTETLDQFRARIAAKLDAHFRRMRPVVEAINAGLAGERGTRSQAMSTPVSVCNDPEVMRSIEILREAKARAMANGKTSEQFNEDLRRAWRSPPAARVLRVLVDAAEHEQTAEKAEAELRADGVDVEAFIASAHEAIAAAKESDHGR